MKRFKIFVALFSCKAYSDRALACKETWLSRLPDNYQFRIFTADETLEETIDDGVNVTLAKCYDDYKNAGFKCIEMLNYIYKNFDFDYIAKIDDDVFFNPDKLNFEDFNGFDYVGSFIKTDHSLIQFASGPTYFISKNFCENIVTKCSKTFNREWYEDVEIALNSLIDFPKLYWNFKDISAKYSKELGHRDLIANINVIQNKAITYLTSYHNFGKRWVANTIRYIAKQNNRHDKSTKKFVIFDKQNSNNKKTLVCYPDSEMHSADLSITGKLIEDDIGININIETDYNSTKLLNFGNNVFRKIGNEKLFESGNIEVVEVDSNISLDFHPITFFNGTYYNKIIKIPSLFLTGWSDELYIFGEGTVTDRYSNESHNKVIYNYNNIFYIDFQNGNVEKFIYEPEKAMMYNVPFGRFENTVDYTKSDSKTVCYFINNPDYELDKCIDIELDELYRASINSCLHNGFHVKVYSFQNIIIDNALSNNIELIDAGTLFSVDEHAMILKQNYDLFKQLFKFLIVSANDDNVIISDDIVFINDTNVPLGYDKTLSYMHLNIKDNTKLKNHLNIISTMLSAAMVNIIKSDTILNDIGEIVKNLMLPLLESNNTLIENLLPDLKHNLAHRYLFEIDKNSGDDYIKSLNDRNPVVIFNKQNISDINYKSYIGQYFI